MAPKSTPTGSSPIAGWVTPKTAYRQGRKLAGMWGLQPAWPIIYPTEPYPTVTDIAMPAPVEGYAAIASRQMDETKRGFLARRTALRQALGIQVDAAGRIGAKARVEAAKTLPAIIYWPLMLLVTCSEFVLNQQVFTVLGEQMLFTIITTLGLAIGLPVLAHFAGAWLRQKRHIPLAWTCVGLAGLAIVAVAVVRAFFFQMEADLGTAIVSASPAALAGIFLLVNAVIFGVALLLSYAHSQVDPEGIAATRSSDLRERDIRRYNEELSGLKREFHAECARINSQFRELAAAFNEGNMDRRRRRDPRQPAWVARLQDVPFPDFPEAWEADPAPASAPAPSIVTPRAAVPFGFTAGGPAASPFLTPMAPGAAHAAPVGADTPGADRAVARTTDQMGAW